MANKGNAPDDVKAQGGKLAAEAKKAPEQKESVYTASEFADNAKAMFQTRRECVLAALRDAGIESCTLSKAREIVGKFLKKEVK